MAFADGIKKIRLQRRRLFFDWKQHPFAAVGDGGRLQVFLQGEYEFQPSGRSVFGEDGSSVEKDGVLYNGQSQSCSAIFFISWFIYSNLLLVLSLLYTPTAIIASKL